jgi:hypothetical protein
LLHLPGTYYLYRCLHNRKELPMAPVQKWSGRETRALREALRMSVRAFAAFLGVGERTVTKWEAGAGDRVPRPEMQAALDTALQGASHETRARFELAIKRQAAPVSGGLGTIGSMLNLSAGDWSHSDTAALASFLSDDHELSADTALRLSHEWRVTDPPQVVEARSGRRIGERLAQVVVERAAVLRHMDDFLGGGDMHGLVRQELHVTLNMVRGASYSEKTGRSLLAAVGELCQLAGWVASDAGLYALAARYYLGGVSAAHAAQDAPLAANLLSSLAYQVANIGDPREAVLLADSAYKGAEQAATPTTRAMLLERVAWANARLGDAEITKRTLDAVDDTFADSNAADDPAWVYWLNRDEIDVMTGRCLTELRQPTRAIALLSHAVSEYDESHAREMALYLSWLAEAHVYAHNIEEAAATGLQAMNLAASVSSVRSLERVQVVQRLLTPYRGTAL